MIKDTKITIRIDDDTKLKAQQKALSKRKTLTQIITEYLKRWVNR